MKKIAIIAAIILASITATKADEVLINKNHANFQSCVVVNLLALNELRSKGISADVIINSPREKVWLGKAQLGQGSVLLSCENNNQKAVRVR